MDAAAVAHQQAAASNQALAQEDRAAQLAEKTERRIAQMRKQLLEECERTIQVRLQEEKAKLAEQMVQQIQARYENEFDQN